MEIEIRSIPLAIKLSREYHLHMLYQLAQVERQQPVGGCLPQFTKANPSHITSRLVLVENVGTMLRRVQLCYASANMHVTFLTL
jgi:hypothetical protein